MTTRHPPAPHGDPPDELRRRVVAELRRARRHLLACAEGATQEQLERRARRGGASMLWHLGHAAFLERGHLARLVGALGADWHPAVLRFGPQSMDMDQLGDDVPLGGEVLRLLAATRKVTDALAASLALDERSLAVFREIVDADHGQARFLRGRRAELGLPPVPEPSSPLLAADTDCEMPPRFHLVGWSRRRRSEGADERGAVVSLEDRRHLRASQALERGHAHVRAGDVPAALAAFEESARWEESADALTYQAWMHSLRGSLDAAERLCLRAIRLDPDFGNPYNDIGTICLQRRDVQGAIGWFQRAKRARRYEPRHFPFLNLGRIYMSLGMPQEALTELEGALALAPDSDDIRALIERLRVEMRG